MRWHRYISNISTGIHGSWTPCNRTGFKVVVLWELFYYLVDSWATNVKEACDDCLFSPATTFLQIAARTSGKRCLFLFRLLLILISKAYGFHVLKRCSEELKNAVNYMNVDDVNSEVGCDKVFGNILYMCYRSKIENYKTWKCRY